MSVASFDTINGIQELLYHVLTFSTPEQNIKNAMVCKTWREVASEIAKKQLIAQLQLDIKTKAANFLKMVPYKLEFYCPSYKKLKDVKANLQNYSLEEVYYMARYDTLCITEKYTVCMAYFIRINPAASQFPKNEKAKLKGKVFVELHYKTDIPGRLGKSYTPALWVEPSNGKRSGPVRFLPIELFNLTVAKDGQTILGDKNTGTVCFALRGRLIEMMIEKGHKDVRNARWSQHSIFGSGDKRSFIEQRLCPDD